MKSLLFLLLAAASPLAAQPPETVVRTVSSAGLDLTTDAGLRALDQRLTIAIVDACGDAYDVDPVGRNAVRACRAEAGNRVIVERERILAAARGTTSTQLAAR